MAREIQTLAFVQGKGWVPPEATAEQEAALVAAYEAAAAELKACKDADERPRLKKALREAHVRCAQECMVEIGRGSIRSIEEGDRNSRVTIGADHLNDPIHGYVDMTDFTLWAQVGVIRANLGRCRYRIIVRRQAEVHPTKPWTKFSEAEQKKRIRDLVVLIPEDAGAATPAAEPGPATALPGPAAAPPAPAPAPAAAAPVAAAAPAATATLFPQAPDGTPVCPLCGHPTSGGGPVFKHAATGRFAHKVCPKTAPAADTPPATGPATTTDEPELGDGPGPAPAAGPGPRLAEPRPWERQDQWGNPNMGSWAIQGAVDMVKLAVELLRDHMAEIGEAAVPKQEAIKALAALLLTAADRAQQIIRPDHRFDRGDYSHARARACVRSALSLYPVPFRTPEETPADLGHRREVWVTNLADFAAMMIQTAVELDR